MGRLVGRREGFLLGFFDGRELVGAYEGFVGQGSTHEFALQVAEGLQQSASFAHPYDPLKIQLPYILYLSSSVHALYAPYMEMHTRPGQHSFPVQL